jgi:hypothetical protein
VKVVATPSTNYEFQRWSGDAAGTDSSLTVTVDSDKEVIGENEPGCGGVGE